MLRIGIHTYVCVRINIIGISICVEDRYTYICMCKDKYNRDQYMC